MYVGRANVGAPTCDETSREWGALGRWGNPFVMTGGSDAERQRVCDAHRASLLTNRLRLCDVRASLAGKRLGCWCGAAQQCHGADLAYVANCPQVDFDALVEEACEACE